MPEIVFIGEGNNLTPTNNMSFVRIRDKLWYSSFNNYNGIALSTIIAVLSFHNAL